MKRHASILAFLLASLAASTAPHAFGEEALAVIINRNNAVESMSLDELRKYCLQERKHWEDNKRVTIVLRDPGQAEREAVLQLIYRMSESDFNRYFLQAEFTGEVQTVPKHLSSAVGVRRFIFNVPGAIGFVRASDVDGTVKVLHVNGHAPGDPQYPLRITNR
jgi:ABC-type phosphate transport system substrate-binding protein